MASEGQFLEIEKRLAAFKHVFNTLQTSANNLITDENFETGHAIYLGDLINEEILFSSTGESTNDTLQPTRISSWVAATDQAESHQNTIDVTSEK